MKGNFWHKIFRKGYDSKDYRYNGNMAKTDAHTSRTKLKNFLKRMFHGGTTITYEEYMQWAKNSIKELSKSIGIPKSFLEKHKEE